MACFTDKSFHWPIPMNLPAPKSGCSTSVSVSSLDSAAIVVSEVNNNTCSFGKRGESSDDLKLLAEIKLNSKYYFVSKLNFWIF